MDPNYAHEPPGDVAQVIEPLSKAAPIREGHLPSYSVFDGLHWDSTRGLGRFSSQLKRHLSRMQWNQLAIPNPPWKAAPGRVLIHEVVEPFWREKLAPDLAFYPHNVMPLLFLTHRSLRVLVVHDVLFLAAGERSWGNRYRRAKLKRSLAAADIVVTVSEYSRAQILQLLVREIPVLVIPNALASGFEAVGPAAPQRRPGVPRILHFGGHAPTKNTQTLLEAVAMLNRDGRPVHLLLAAMSAQSNRVEEWRRHAQLDSAALTVLPSMTDEELRQTYADADLHCMPSTGEGFGIPVIEAARLGAPNVLSPLPVFREMVGEDAVYARSFESNDIALAIQQALASDLRAMVFRAQARSSRYLFESVHNLDAVLVLTEARKMAACRLKKGL